MAENEQYNDEYHFTDPDMASSDSLHDEESALATGSSSKPSIGATNNTWRNALIAVGIIIFIMFAYKFLSSFFPTKSQPEQAVVPQVEQAVAPQVEQAPQPPVAHPVQPPVQPLVQQATPPENTEVTQKLSALAVGQQSVHSEIDSLSSQVVSINTNVSELIAKIADLNQLVTLLAAKVDQQSREIAVFAESAAKPKPVRQVARRAPPSRNHPMYYIQAVIPGRAWLIAGNGSTLTVREGTQIPGYGVVKLIDPNQGRVITSSGQVIRFSQQDS